MDDKNNNQKKTDAAKFLFSQNVENLELIRNCLVKGTQDKRYLVFNCLEKAHRELDALNRGTNNKKDPADCEFINQLVLSHNGIFSDSRKYLLLYKAVKEHTQDTDSLEKRKQAIIACNLRSIDEEDIERFCSDWKGATSLTVTNKNLYAILMGILHPKEQINHEPSSLQKTLNTTSINTTSIPQTPITTTSATNLTPPSLSNQP